MNEHAKALSAELTALELNDEHALLSFLPLAARLAVLDEPSQLRRAMDRVRHAPGFEGLLLDRCKEGVWDLRSALGEFLALAVIAAQDFACLRDLEQESLTEAVCLAIQSWVDCAEATSLDMPGVEMLEVFLERFPIPERYRLGVVDSPTEEVGLECMAEAASRVPPTEMIEVELRGEVLHAEELAFADIDQVPAALVDNWSVVEKELSAPAVGALIYSQRLYADWRIVIDMVAEGASIPAVETVRVGPFTAIRQTDRPSRWVVDLGTYPRPCRIRAIDESVVVTFHNGTRLRIL